MKHLQLLVGIFCFSAIIKKSSADGEITLQKLIFKDMKMGKKDKVSITFKSETMTKDYDNHRLVFTDESPPGNEIPILSSVTPVEVDNVNNIKSLEFDIDEDVYPSIIESKRKLSLYSKVEAGGLPELEGHININMDNPFVEQVKIAAIGWDSSTQLCDFRMANTVPDNFIVSGGTLTPANTCHVSSNRACYIMQFTVLADDKFSVCGNIATDGDEDLQLCSEPYACDTGATTGFADNVVTVDYQAPNIEITTTNLNGGAKWEMVLSNTTVTVCGGAFDKVASPICPPTKKEDLDILLVGVKDNGDVKNYLKTSVTDIDLSAQALGTGSHIIEVNLLNLGNKLFHMKRTDGAAPDNSYKEVNVDCHEIPDDKSCTGYFVDLTEATYTITVKTRDDDGNAIKTPVYSSNEVQIPGVLPESTKDIGIENVEVKQKVAENVAKFCFLYNQKIMNKTAQYEIILINKKGNWKRTALKTEFEDNQDCSTAIDFPLEQFDEDFKVKMLFLARDIHTDKVLASGEKTLQISDPKAIKPEMDNSSEGYTRMLAIVGTAVGGVACMVALVAAAILLVMKRNRNNDGLQYPLHRTSIENSDIIHGLENPYSTM